MGIGTTTSAMERNYGVIEREVNLCLRTPGTGVSKNNSRTLEESLGSQPLISKPRGRDSQSEGGNNTIAGESDNPNPYKKSSHIESVR